MKLESSAAERKVNAPQKKATMQRKEHGSQIL
jgi:hypothetical protein